LNGKSGVAVGVAGALMSLTGGTARVHWDTMDGPVVHHAQKALETNHIPPALIWSRSDAESELRDVLRHAVAGRRTTAGIWWG
jgi:hypothetical protein